ncbi:UNVERIFIED_CONTAM: hypothetical protein GTU68_028221 [Idotea baltica]|nr:hypothetical protein [Idotea baltica]
MMDCKKALTEANGDIDKAIEILRKKGQKLSVKRAEREANEGVVIAKTSHNKNNGIVLRLSCETDFVAKGAQFEEGGKNSAMQVAAMKPIALDKADVPQEIVDKEIEIGKELAKTEGKPEAMLDKIAAGRLNKFFKETTLLNQVYVKDGSQTISTYLKSLDPELTITEFKHISLG